MEEHPSDPPKGSTMIILHRRRNPEETKEKDEVKRRPGMIVLKRSEENKGITKKTNNERKITLHKEKRPKTPDSAKQHSKLKRNKSSSAKKARQIVEELGKLQSTDEIVTGYVDLWTIDKLQEEIICKLTDVQFHQSKSSTFEAASWQAPNAANDCSNYKNDLINYCLPKKETKVTPSSELPSFAPPSPAQATKNKKHEGISYVLNTIPPKLPSFASIEDFITNSMYYACMVGGEGSKPTPMDANTPPDAASAESEMNVMTDELTIDHIKVMKAMDNATKLLAKGELTTKYLTSIADMRSTHKTNLNWTMANSSCEVRPRFPMQLPPVEELNFSEIYTEDLWLMTNLVYIIECNSSLTPKHQINITKCLSKLVPLLQSVKKCQKSDAVHFIGPLKYISFIFYSFELFAAWNDVLGLVKLQQIRASFAVFKRMKLPRKIIFDSSEIKVLCEWVELGGLLSPRFFQARNTAIPILSETFDFFGIAKECIDNSLPTSEMARRAATVASGRRLYGLHFNIGNGTMKPVLVPMTIPHVPLPIFATPAYESVVGLPEKLKEFDEEDLPRRYIIDDGLRFRIAVHPMPFAFVEGTSAFFFSLDTGI